LPLFSARLITILIFNFRPS